MALQGAVNISSASSQTLTSSYSIYVYSGSGSATWTLPAISGNSGEILILWNRGSGTVTITRTGSDQIDNQGGLLTSVTLPPNGSLELLNDGAYWLVMTASSQVPTFDNSAQGTNFLAVTGGLTSGTATTWTHTVGAGNPYGIICLYSIDTATTPDNTSAVVTFGGVALAQLGFVLNGSLGGMWLFGGANIPSGSQTASVKLTRSGAGFSFVPMSFTYSNVATPGAFWSNQGSNQTMWVTLPRTSSLPARGWLGLSTTNGSGTAMPLYASTGLLRQHFDNHTQMTAWGFDTGLAGSDPATLAAGTNGNIFTAAGLELFGQLPAGPFLHTVGNGLVMNGAFGGTANSFTHLSRAGTYALVAVWYRPNTGTSLGGVSFGGTAMTQLASVYLNNDATGAHGQLFIYGLANVSGGPQTVALTYTGGLPTWVVANSATYYQVSNVGAAATTYGTGTALSQGPIAATPGQIIFQCFASYDNVALAETGSETNLYEAAIASYQGSVSINQFPSATHTFAATSAGANPWAGAAVVLS